MRHLALPMSSKLFRNISGWRLKLIKKYLVAIKALMVRNLLTSAGDVRDSSRSLGQEGPLEEGMGTHCSILAGESHGQRSLAGSDTTETTQRTKRY